MFYRAFVAAILLFWLWMMAALVRLTVLPGLSEPMPVPTSYIWKLVFLHEEPSDLILYNQRRRIGNLHLQPHRLAEAEGGQPGLRRMNAVGGCTVDVPWAGRQSVIIHSSLDLGTDDTIVRVRLSASFNHPKPTMPGVTIVLEGEPERDRWHYVVRNGDDPLEERSGTVAELLDRPELRELGIDPATLLRRQGQVGSAYSVTARHGKLQVNRDTVETYVVSIKDGNGLENTIHLNQLGQILAVNTFAGVHLLDGALSP